MNDIHYFAKNTDEITCDSCDAFLCYGFINYADDSGFLCTKCHAEQTTLQLPEVTKQKQERLARKEKERLCGESTEGHDWIDISNQTLVMGSRVYSCTKCEAEKLEPFDLSGVTLSTNSLK